MPARRSPARLPRGAGHLPHRDLRCFADIILPASAWPGEDRAGDEYNRRVQMGRPALPVRPETPREDLAIIIDLARHSGWAGIHTHPREVFAEMAQVMPSMANITGSGWSAKTR